MMRRSGYLSTHTQVTRTHWFRIAMLAFFLGLMLAPEIFSLDGSLDMAYPSLKKGRYAFESPQLSINALVVQDFPVIGLGISGELSAAFVWPDWPAEAYRSDALELAARQRIPLSYDWAAIIGSTAIWFPFATLPVPYNMEAAAFIEFHQHLKQGNITYLVEYELFPEAGWYSGFSWRQNWPGEVFFLPLYISAEVYWQRGYDHQAETWLLPALFSLNFPELVESILPLHIRVAVGSNFDLFSTEIGLNIIPYRTYNSNSLVLDLHCIFL